MKKYLILALCLMLTGCGGSEKSETEAPTSKPTESVTQQVTTEAETTEEETTEAVTEAAGEDKSELKEALKDAGIDITYQDFYRNDSTGKWKLSRVACTTPTADYAMDYYKAYFSSDDEIHVVVNFTLKTTTCIKKMANMLFVDTFEYVSKEEHDASVALSGTLLDSQILDIE